MHDLLNPGLAQADPDAISDLLYVDLLIGREFYVEDQPDHRDPLLLARKNATILDIKSVETNILNKILDRSYSLRCA